MISLPSNSIFFFKLVIKGNIRNIASQTIQFFFTILSDKDLIIYLHFF